MFRQIRVQYLEVDHGASFTSFQLSIGYLTYSDDKRHKVTTELIIAEEPHTITVRSWELQLLWTVSDENRDVEFNLC